MRRAVVGRPVAALAIAAVLLVSDVIGQAAAADAGAKVPSAKARPQVAVVDLNGVKQIMRKSRGRALVVHFWASWCLPCMEEMPLVNKFAGEMKTKGVDLLSLSLDNPETHLGRVAEVLSETGPNLTATVVKVDDADTFIASFDRAWEGAIPALFAFDNQGKLRGHHFGEATRPVLDRLVNDATRTWAGGKR